MTFARLLAASALMLKAASLNLPTAARALGLLLLLLCGAVSVWRWGARRRRVPLEHSPHGSTPDVTHAAGTSTSNKEVDTGFLHAHETWLSCCRGWASLAA